MINTPFSPTISIGIFIITTIIFYFVKVKIIFSDLKKGKSNDNKPGTSKNMMLYAIYLCIVLCIEFILNYTITKSLCGSPQWMVILKVTLIPWIAIFGSLKLLLMTFPGWLLPFSNTIGYGIVSLFGAGTHINKIFLDNNNNKQKGYLSFILERLYDDKSALINQFTENNYTEKVYNMLKELNKSPASVQDSINELKKLIILKGEISEFIWNLLTGILTTSVSYNYIVKTKCKNTIQKMEERHRQYEQMIKEEDEIEKVKPEVQVID